MPLTDQRKLEAGRMLNKHAPVFAHTSLFFYSLFAYCEKLEIYSSTVSEL